MTTQPSTHVKCQQQNSQIMTKEYEENRKKYNHHTYSNRGCPQIKADSNTSRFVRASPSSLNDQIFKNSSKLGCLIQNWLIAKNIFALALMYSKMTLIEAEGNLNSK